jgi:hypothetical protein
MNEVKTDPVIERRKRILNSLLERAHLAHKKSNNSHESWETARHHLMRSWYLKTNDELDALLQGNTTQGAGNS